MLDSKRIAKSVPLFQSFSSAFASPFGPQLQSRRDLPCWPCFSGLEARKARV